MTMKPSRFSLMQVHVDVQVDVLYMYFEFTIHFIFIWIQSNPNRVGLWEKLTEITK